MTPILEHQRDVRPLAKLLAEALRDALPVTIAEGAQHPRRIEEDRIVPTVRPLDPKPRFVVVNVPQGSMIVPLILTPYYRDELNEVKRQAERLLRRLWADILKGTWSPKFTNGAPVIHGGEWEDNRNVILTPNENVAYRLAAALAQGKGIANLRVVLGQSFPGRGTKYYDSLLRKRIFYVEDERTFVRKNLNFTVMTARQLTSSRNRERTTASWQRRQQRKKKRA